MKVMICNKCGKTINDDSVFCEYCGNKIEIKKRGKKERRRILQILRRADIRWNAVLL